MTPERWQQIDMLIKSALERRPDDRAAYLDHACAGDATLRDEVNSLLEICEREGSFMETPAVASAAHSLLTHRAELTAGQFISHYRIIHSLGEGGMGEVYLAQDLTLGRKIALKLLPSHFGKDADRLQRFELEARAASALNDPNVCMIHEVGETAEGRHYIVMEYVEGETLRQRLASTRMNLIEVLDIAIQIASALAAAHTAGIVHRDIKPENVILRNDGYVKVLDFGLAKLTEQRSVADSSLPTRPHVHTDTGMVMGTATYMSPEQARGVAVDSRADIWSLGVVLYEMVAGRVPFEGETPSHVIVSILEKEPAPLAAYLPETPVELQRIITRALQKEKLERYQTAEELLVDLKSFRQKIGSETEIETVAVPAARTTHKSAITVDGKALRMKWLISLAVMVLLIGIGGSAWFYVSRPAVKPALPPMKVVPFTSYQGEEYMPSFSPDGNMIAFGWHGERGAYFDASSIYVKQIGSEQPLRLTYDSSYLDFGPVWSPDGQRIAFNRHTATECAIFIVPALGGVARKLITLGPNPGWETFPSLAWSFPSLAWSPDGRFIAVPFKDSKEEPYKIFLVSLDTQTRQSLTSPPAGNVGDFEPAFSPDGQSVAFFRVTPNVSSDIYIVPIGGGEPSRLTFDNAIIRGLDWTADGREIVFSSNRVGETPGTDGSGLWRLPVTGLWRIPVTGGKPERVPLDADNVWFPRIARHGNRLTYVQATPDDANIYRIEVSDKAVSKDPPTKLIASTRFDGGPEFSPDGKRIIFHSDRSGPLEIWMCNSDGTNLVQVTSLNKRAGSPRWSPDGQQIAFDVFENGKGDVYVVSVEGGPPRPIVIGDSSDHLPSWSRDGKWIYFGSDRTGQDEVWKAPSDGGEPVQVTRHGGLIAFESYDGKYVYFIKPFPTQGIWQVPVDGGEEHQILGSFQTVFDSDWAVANGGIFFVNEHTTGEIVIEFFDFSTRKVRQVASLGDIKLLENCIAVSTDGRQILYTQNDQGSADITLVENFQ